MLTQGRVCCWLTAGGDPPYITAYAIDPVVKLKGSTGGLVHYLGEIDPGDVYGGLEIEPIFKDAAEREGSILDIEYLRPVDA